MPSELLQANPLVVRSHLKVRALHRHVNIVVRDGMMIVIGARFLHRFARLTGQKPLTAEKRHISVLANENVLAVEGYVRLPHPNFAGAAGAWEWPAGDLVIPPAG